MPREQAKKVITLQQVPQTGEMVVSDQGPKFPDLPSVAADNPKDLSKATQALITMSQQGEIGPNQQQAEPQGVGQYFPQQEQTQMAPTNDDLAGKYSAIYRQMLGEQRSGITELEKEYARLAKEKPGFNWKALAAFGEYVQGLPPGFSQMLKAPDTMRERNERMLALKDKIQRHRSDLTKTQLEALKAQIELAKGPGKEAAAQLKDWATMQKGKFYQLKGPIQIHQYAINGMANDKTVQRSVATVNALERAKVLVSKMKTSDAVTAQQVDDLQQMVVAAVQSGAGTMGVGEREKRYLNSLDMEFAKLKQYLTGKPVNVYEKNPKLVDHIMNMINVESQTSETQGKLAMQKAKKAWGWFYDNNPEMSQSLDAYSNVLYEQLKAGAVKNTIMNDEQKKEMDLLDELEGEADDLGIE